MAVIAATIAFAFAKLARQHNSKSNGVGYVYARTNMGRMTGLLVGFMQYVYIPFSLTYQLVSMIKKIANYSGFVKWGAFFFYCY